jgi:hypothetical protein
MDFNHANITVEQPLLGRTDTYTITSADHLRVWFEDGSLHVEHTAGGRQ